MIDETLLLQRVKAGDRTAFDSLVDRYHREIYFLALRFMKNAEDAEDVTQQAFVRAFEKIDSFRGDAAFNTWLYRVTVNLCNTRLRSRKETAELNENTRDERSQDDSPSAGIIKQEAASAASAAVESLPEKQRLAVSLRVFNELSYREIGEIIGCSEQTAKVNFHYGMENLRKKMKQNGPM